MVGLDIAEGGEDWGQGDDAHASKGGVDGSERPNPDAAATLKHLMQASGFSSLRALSRGAEVSFWQVQQLRAGKVPQMRIEVLQKLAGALQVPLRELLLHFQVLGDPAPAILPKQGESQITLGVLQQEYDRLQAQLLQQQSTLQQAFRRDTLQTLESLFLQLPTATYAVQQNPQLLASKLLPLLRPLEQLLRDWGIEAIGAVGSQAPYDPQCHQLLEGHAMPGDLVQVRYLGYRQGEQLLYRAKVSPP